MNPKERALQRQYQVLLAGTVLVYLVATALMSIWWGLAGTGMAVVLTLVTGTAYVLSVKLDVYPKNKEDRS